jgi:hypothetical protein
MKALGAYSTGAAALFGLKGLQPGGRLRRQLGFEALGKAAKHPSV